MKIIKYLEQTLDGDIILILNVCE